MKAIMVLGSILAGFLLLGFLRFRLVISLHGTIMIRLRIGPYAHVVIPRRAKKRKKSKEETAGENQEEQTDGQSEKGSRLPRLSIDDWMDLIPILWSALPATARRVCRRTRIDPLEVTAVFSDPDPFFAASLYGTANMLLFALFPRIEETFDVPDPSVHLRIGFEESRPSLTGEIGVSLTLHDLIAILFTLAVPLLKWYFRFRKNQRQAQTSSAA